MAFSVITVLVSPSTENEAIEGASLAKWLVNVEPPQALISFVLGSRADKCLLPIQDDVGKE